METRRSISFASRRHHHRRPCPKPHAASRSSGAPSASVSPITYRNKRVAINVIFYVISIKIVIAQPVIFRQRSDTHCKLSVPLSLLPSSPLQAGPILLMLYSIIAHTPESVAESNSKVRKRKIWTGRVNGTVESITSEWPPPAQECTINVLSLRCAHRRNPFGSPTIPSRCNPSHTCCAHYHQN